MRKGAIKTEQYIVNIEAAVCKEGRWLLAERSIEEEHAGGELALVGGKIEGVETLNHVLEETLKREIMEEVGISIYDDVQYVKSSAFVTDAGKPVIDIVLLCQYKEGEATVRDPKELSNVVWLSIEEILQHDNVQSWTKESLEIAETMRLKHA